MTRGPGADRLIAGVHPVREALRAGQPLHELRLARGRDDARAEEVRALARDRGVAVTEVDRAELDRATPDVPHQGVVALAPPFPYVPLADLLAAARRPALVVALDGVTDPHNVGAIARTAEAFGADGLLLPGRRAAGVTTVAEKAAAGALAHLPVAVVGNLAQALERCGDAGLWRVGLQADAPTMLADAPVRSEPAVLVIGAEGRGLARLTAQRCDLSVAIPLVGRVASLNASVAAALALYEFARGRAERPG